MNKNNTQNGILWPALKAAFPQTIPILTGFGFLGISYGIYMRVSGFSWLWSLLIGITVFGGSLQFVGVSMLLGGFAPLQTFTAALMIQARHLFYGIAMLEKYKGKGFKKLYLIFAMCDESFSINCSVNAPDGVDEGWFMFFVNLLDQFYWVTASAIGGLLGGMIPFDTTGLEFVMTAMFVVIFLERWLQEKTHYTAYIGLISAAVCRLLFGAEHFLIPTMICILALLTVLRKPIERAGGTT